MCIGGACENPGAAKSGSALPTPLPCCPFVAHLPAPPSKHRGSFLQCFPIALALQHLEEISMVGKPGELIVHFLSDVICKKNVE